MQRARYADTVDCASPALAWMWLTHTPTSAGTRAIAALADRGRLRAHVSATFPLAVGARAHALGETGRITGKLVLTVP